MNTKPLADRVAIKPAKDEETNRNGIILLAGMQARLPGRGTVVAVGPGRITDEGRVVPLKVKVGDEVLFPRGQGIPCEVNDESCVLLFDGELYGIVSGEVKNVPPVPSDD